MPTLQSAQFSTAGFTWVLFGNVLYSACQWGIILVFARMGTPADVGEYALGMAISAPILLFANFQLRAVVASDLANRFRIGQYLAFRLFTLAIALMAIGAAGVLSQGISRRSAVIALVGLAQIIDLISDTFYGWMQKHEQLDRLAKSQAFKGPLGLTLLTWGMYATRQIEWAVAGLVLGRLIVLVLWDSPPVCGRRMSEFRFEWSGIEMWRLAKSVLPLGVISMLVSLNTNIPSYFIEARLGAAELGILSALASLLSAGSLIVAAFGQSIFRRVALAVAIGDRAGYRGFVVQATLLGLGLGAAGAAAASLGGREVLSALFRPEYGERADVLPLLVAAGTASWMSSGAGYVLTAARCLVPQLPVLALTCVTGVTASAWAIPRHGLQGAAEAVLIAGIVHLTGTGVILWRFDRQLPRTPDPARELSVSAGAKP